MQYQIKKSVVLTYTEEEFLKAKNELDNILGGKWDDEKLNEASKKIDIWTDKYFGVLI